MTWNWIDVVILLIVGLNAFNGVRRGMVRSFFGLIGLVLGLFVCLKGTPFIVEMLRQFNLSGLPIFVTAVIIIFVIIYWLVSEIGKQFKALIAESSFQQFDTLGGLLLGFTKGVVYTLFFLVPLLGNIFASPTLMSTYESSTLLAYVRPLVYTAQPIVERAIAQATEQWQTYQEVVPKIIEHDSRWHSEDDAASENAEPLSNY